MSAVEQVDEAIGPDASMVGPYRILDVFSASAHGITTVNWVVVSGNGVAWLHNATNYGSHESYCIGIYDLLGVIDAMRDLDPFSAEAIASREPAQGARS